MNSRVAGALSLVAGAVMLLLPPFAVVLSYAGLVVIVVIGWWRGTRRE